MNNYFLAFLILFSNSALAAEWQSTKDGIAILDKESNYSAVVTGYDDVIFVFRQSCESEQDAPVIGMVPINGSLYNSFIYCDPKTNLKIIKPNNDETNKSVYELLEKENNLFVNNKLISTKNFNQAWIEFKSK
ncbi:hypothetical protein AKG94_21470 [Vibrio harveyi]|uniref:hypothetical protein n=1 Tax=Vibrio harveyi TaxID=669 RepID=UPI00069E47B8|nr:hypothetical protein [Vibrio harveyi]KNY40442.1 hypothetical protein AKG94_21470 [Vibrio harveyi]